MTIPFCGTPPGSQQRCRHQRLLGMLLGRRRRRRTDASHTSALVPARPSRRSGSTSPAGDGERHQQPSGIALNEDHGQQRRPPDPYPAIGGGYRPAIDDLSFRMIGENADATTSLLAKSASASRVPGMQA